MLGSFPVGSQPIASAEDDGWAVIPNLPTSWSEQGEVSNPWTVLD